MASIDEVMSELQGAADEVDGTIQTLTRAESDTGETQGQMAALGFDDKVEHLAAVKDAIEKARDHLAGGKDLIEEALNQARAAKG